MKTEQILPTDSKETRAAKIAARREEIARLAEEFIGKIIANDPGLTIIEINLSQIDPVILTRIIVALRQNTIVNELRIKSDSPIKTETLSALMPLKITLNPAIKSISFILPNINNLGIIKIVNTLASTIRNLSTLKLDHTPLGDTGAFKLARILPLAQSLRKLSIGNCQIGDTGITALAGKLPGLPSLKVLILKKNPITSTGFIAITINLANSSLQKIDLSLMDQRTGIYGVIDALRENQYLQRINLEETPLQLTDAEAIGNTLRVTHFLRTLMLAQSFVTAPASAVHAVILGLKFNHSLYYLDLSENPLDINAVSILVDALKANHTLKKLRLHDNELNDESAIAIAHALTGEDGNHSLQVLDLENNQIGDVGARALAEMLKLNTALIDLDLENNPLNITGIQDLLNALTMNFILRELGINIDNDDDGEVTKNLEKCLHRNQILATEATVRKSWFFGTMSGGDLSLRKVGSGVLNTIHAML